MKSLKLDHALAQLVLAGRKSSTWRVNDDKDLRVNDVVQLVDKVDATDPASWRVIGEALITSVLEKQFVAVDQADMDEGEHYESLEKMLEVFRNYYGPQVNGETPVKIIRFKFTPHSGGEVFDTRHAAGALVRAKLYTDGGSRGNPGPSACGYVLLDENDTIIVENGLFLGVTTNNQAEYSGLKIGLEEALHRGIKQLDVYMDSLLVVNQMLGKYKVKNHDLVATNMSTKQLASQFQKISFTHIPRELNKMADAIVNEILDANSKQTVSK